MQCSKCKNAYYCSMKCLNDDLRAHCEFCDSVRIRSEPKGRAGVTDKLAKQRQAAKEAEQKFQTKLGDMIEAYRWYARLGEPPKKVMKAIRNETMGMNLSDGEIDSLPWDDKE